MGDWVGPYFEADALARTITEAFPIEGQPAAGAVDRLVADCSATLGVDKPLVYIRNSPLTRAYAVRAGGRHHLVLTSGLLNLFAGRPGELKFVVGRELGHVVCDHAELRSKAYALLAAAQAINVAVVPDRYQNALPLLALGRLYSWSRESEISADRGGLLCCVEPSVDLSGDHETSARPWAADSPWIDAGAKDFDADAVVRSFRQWQYRPFVGFLLYVRQQPLEHPYYQERLAALRQWSDTGAPRAILARRCEAASGQLVEVTRIRAYELASEGKSVSPYAIVFDGRPACPDDGDVERGPRRGMEGIQEHGSRGRPAASLPRRPAALLRALGRRLFRRLAGRRVRGVCRRPLGNGRRLGRSVGGIHGADPVGLEGSGHRVAGGLRAGAGQVQPSVVDDRRRAGERGVEAMRRAIRSGVRLTISLLLTAAMVGCDDAPRTGEAGPPSADPPASATAPVSPAAPVPIEKR